jgi:hypothetical protein
MPQCLSLKEQVTRFAYGDSLSTADERTVKAHLAVCAACRDFVSFVKKSRAVARTNAASDTGRTGCPSIEQLQNLQEGNTDEVREHVLNCMWCRGEYLLLSSLAEEEIPDLRSDKRTKQRTGHREASKSSSEVEDALNDEYWRVATEFSQYARRLEYLQYKRYLSDDEKLEELRLKKLKLRLKDELERVQLEQARLQDAKNKLA